MYISKLSLLHGTLKATPQLHSMQPARAVDIPLLGRTCLTNVWNLHLTIGIEFLYMANTGAKVACVV